MKVLVATSGGVDSSVAAALLPIMVLASFDFGVGSDDYKLQYCKDGRQPLLDSYLPLSAKGHVAARLLSLETSIKRAIKQSPTAMKLLKPVGRVIPLIKPQFEAGRAEVGNGGVVRSEAVWRDVLERVLAQAEVLGLAVEGLTASPLLGPAGNVEFLANLVRGPLATPRRRQEDLVDDALAEARLREEPR